MESGIGESAAVEVEAVCAADVEADAEPVTVTPAIYDACATASNAEGAGGCGVVGKVINWGDISGRKCVGTSPRAVGTGIKEVSAACGRSKRDLRVTAATKVVVEGDAGSAGVAEVESGIGEGAAVEIKAVGAAGVEADAEPVTVTAAVYDACAIAANAERACGGGVVGKVVNWGNISGRKCVGTSPRAVPTGIKEVGAGGGSGEGDLRI